MRISGISLGFSAPNLWSLQPEYLCRTPNHELGFSALTGDAHEMQSPLHFFEPVDGQKKEALAADAEGDDGTRVKDNEDDDRTRVNDNEDDDRDDVVGDGGVELERCEWTDHDGIGKHEELVIGQVTPMLDVPINLGVEICSSDIDALRLE